MAPPFPETDVEEDHEAIFPATEADELSIA
jgi:hypothetical protein